MNIPAILDPDFEPRPTAIVAWSPLNGRWYVELVGVPMADFVSETFASLDEAIAWGRAHAPRVLAQDPDAPVNPEIREGDAELIERIRRQQVLPTSADELIRGARPIVLKAMPDMSEDAWYLIQMWDPESDLADIETWRIGAENRITDVLRWIAESLGQKTWALHLITTSAGQSNSTELFGQGPGYYVDDAPRHYLDA